MQSHQWFKLLSAILILAIGAGFAIADGDWRIMLIAIAALFLL